MSADDTDALEGVDVIIANSTTQASLAGTSGGKNSSGINNDYSGTMEDWAAAHGFTGDFIYGDDYGTSTNQGFGEVDATEDGMAPLLYCQRNYTADKVVRGGVGVRPSVSRAVRRQCRCHLCLLGGQGVPREYDQRGGGG